jgi:hypothetical protein
MLVNKHEFLSCQAFRAMSNISGLGQEPTLEWGTCKALLANIRLGCENPSRDKQSSLLQT